jgi:hypothetical protein
MKLNWKQIENGDREVWISQILKDDAVEVPFVIVLVAEDWVGQVGEADLDPKEHSFYERNGAIYLANLHLLPPLTEEAIDDLGIEGYPGTIEFPDYAGAAVGQGLGCYVMPEDARPGTAVWSTKMHADIDDAVAEAKRHAEKHVAGNIYDILGRPVNRAGDMAEKNFWYSAQRPDEE